MFGLASFSNGVFAIRAIATVGVATRALRRPDNAGSGRSSQRALADHTPQAEVEAENSVRAAWPDGRPKYV